MGTTPTLVICYLSVLNSPSGYDATFSFVNLPSMRTLGSFS